MESDQLDREQAELDREDLAEKVKQMDRMMREEQEALTEAAKLTVRVRELKRRATERRWEAARLLRIIRERVGGKVAAGEPEAHKERPAKVKRGKSNGQAD